MSQSPILSGEERAVQGATPSGPGSQAAPEAAEASSPPVSIPSADEARRLSITARDHWGVVQGSYSEALAAVRAEWEPKVLAALWA